MPEWYDIARKEQFGRGKEAAVLGQPWRVYRLKNTASGAILQPANKLYEQYYCAFKVNTAALKNHMLAEKIPGVILYELTMDTFEGGIKVGDIFELNDPFFGQGFSSVDWETEELNAFVVAQNMPNKLTIGVRLNMTARIYRQTDEPIQEGGRTAAWAPDHGNTDVLTMQNGQFVFAPRDGATNICDIPIGIFPVSRPYGDKQFTDAPAMLRKSGWSGFLPPLRGVLLREGDRIVTPDGSEYMAIIAGRQETGLAGTYVFLEREIASEAG